MAVAKIHATSAPAEFVYQRLPELVAGEARLAQLRSELDQAGGQASALSRARDTAQAALLRAETDTSMGQKADVAGARRAFEQAQSVLAAYQPRSQALKTEIKALDQRLEPLRQQERELNARALREFARPIVDELRGLLRPAAEPAKKLFALAQSVGKFAHGRLPSEHWIELFAQSGRGYTSICKLDAFEREARRLGLLD